MLIQSDRSSEIKLISNQDVLDNLLISTLMKRVNFNNNIEIKSYFKSQQVDYIPSYQEQIALVMNSKQLELKLYNKLVQEKKIEEIEDKISNLEIKLREESLNFLYDLNLIFEQDSVYDKIQMEIILNRDILQKKLREIYSPVKRIR
jgi:hypothetical protein